MRHNPFQEKLRPRATIEIGHPIRQSLRPYATEEIAAAKRAVHHHGDPAFLSQWQNLILRFTFHDRIIDLEKIELLVPQHFFYFGKSARLVMRDADVTKAPPRFPVAQRGELRRHVNEVVHLHQIDAFRLQPRERTFHRVDPGLFTARPNFRCQKKFLMKPQLGREGADDLFGSAVHWRGIDYTSADFHELRENVAELLLTLWRKIDVEYSRCTQTDDGKFFTGSRDRAGQH